MSDQPAWIPPDHLLDPAGASIGPLAPVTARVIAAILSAVTWLTLSIVASLVMFAIWGDELAYGWLVLWWFVPFAINTVLIATKGWDPGKLLMRLRVVDATGRPPGLGHAALRTVVVQLPMLASWLPGVAGAVAGWLYLPWLLVLLATIATDADRQGWHDRVAHTHVVIATNRAGRPVPR